MKNHGGWGGHGDYTTETERGILRNPLDVAAGLAQGIYAIYRVISFPVRKSLERFATRSCEGICHAEGLEDSDLDQS